MTKKRRQNAVVFYGVLCQDILGKYDLLNIVPINFTYTVFPEIFVYLIIHFSNFHAVLISEEPS